ncbi:hypothetical protein I4641_19620 [Waterburya agarophytonicola K14]|uniref:Uncharacterized protein n=1 Tax=Waterburya agarophytonicola KI4 TaxID=2874699 RepID=A0A964BT48_9CYAN|nr:hypothetical protein [Waterburya agarophytonicola]MCC0179178.1 hypothetical protein [Waterburya agarophytonicola KI4]
MTSTYEISSDLTEFNSLISENINNGLNLVDVEYADGLWFATLRNTSGSSRGYVDDNVTDFADQFQATKTYTYDFSSTINSFDLVDVEYADGLWYSTYGNVDGLSDYTISNTFDDFTGAVQDYWDLGYDLVDIEYADGAWLATYGDIPGDSKYLSPSSLNDFDNVVQQESALGYGVVDVEYADGAWVGVFGNYSGSTANTVAYSGSFDEFDSQFEEKSNLGYDLIDIAYGDGIWIGLYSPTIADTTYTTPSLYDQSQLNQGFNNYVVSNF